MLKQPINGTKKKPVQTVALTGFSREKHRKLLQQARREVKRARSYGLSDQEIIDALKGGDEHHQAYAQYIEFFIMKAG